MAQDRLGDVQADAAKENGQHGDPGEVFEEGGKKGMRLGAVAEDAEGEVAEEAEDQDDGEVDLEAVDVIMIQMAVEPADDAVAGERRSAGGWKARGEGLLT